MFGLVGDARDLRMLLRVKFLELVKSIQYGTLIEILGRRRTYVVVVYCWLGFVVFKKERVTESLRLVVLHH